MADDNVLSGSLQETILTALVHGEDSYSKSISRLVDLNWFEDPYQEIVAKILKHWREYDKPPSASHIDDVFDLVLNDPNNRKNSIYNRVFDRLARLKNNLNTKYVYNRLYEFARRQNLKRAIFEAGTILSQSTEPEDYDKVEAILSSVTRFEYDKYDTGFLLSNTARSLRFLERQDSNDRMRLNIKQLDDEGIGPGRGELFLFMAPRGRGKSMFLHHVGRRATHEAKWRVLHITLENSEEHTAQRYFQSEFGIVVRDNADGITIFKRENNKADGNVVGFTREKNPAKHFPNSESISKHIQTMITGKEDYDQSLAMLRIKEFPTGDLTYDQLEAFLDHLEGIEDFRPDAILLDYPDLMSYDRRHDPRLGLGRLFQQLRGLAVKRNLAMVVVTQTNREGESARVVEGRHAAEDISKIATADYVLTFNQTRQEYELGLARLFVSKARNERQWFTVLITQNYAAAQFCLFSAPMKPINNYTSLLEETPTIVPEEENNARATG